ncbi:putative RING finger protein [Lachnellula occidentalis]|uniref:Putative RING finger protein n=1 Tax=Lachnellula occidentalis TaxID=215460 RepID=A0A8H8RWL3_9HELO|nr:putative RING finger protein [Lachnellula occidentalis]
MPPTSLASSTPPRGRPFAPRRTREIYETGLSRMSSIGSSAPGETILDPSSLTDEELLKMPLKHIAKNISLTTSSRITMSAYLRWLEIHRCSSSKLSEHWSNTLMHWVQSLRSRGFLEHELISEVNAWKEENGPFRSVEKRHLPNAKNIMKVFGDGTEPPFPLDERRYLGREPRERPWDERREESSRTEDQYRLKKEAKSAGYLSRWDDSRDQYQAPPPKGYICNRCGGKGHHLQVCPTNMDPSYDEPPASFYVCSCCQVRGDHYRSLCPRNPDPNSIYQRRKAHGIRTPRNDRSSDYDSQMEFGRMKETRRERGEGSQYSNTTTPERMSGARRRLEEVISERARLFSEEKTDVDELGLIPIQGPRQANANIKRERTSSMSSTGSISTRQRGPRKLQRTSEKKEADTSMFDTEAANFRVKRETFNNGNQANHRTTLYDCRMTDDKYSAGENIEYTPTKPKKPRATVELGRLTPVIYDSDLESDADETHTIFGALQQVKPTKQYSTFVKDLIARHLEMKEIVNEIKKRPTAIEMAKQNQQQQHKRAKVPSPGRTPIKPEAEYLESTPQKFYHYPASRSRSLASDYFESSEIPQLDGAFDEDPVAYDRLPSRKYKLGSLGKGALGKVQTITTNVAQSFPDFKSGGCSESRPPAKWTQPIVNGSKSESFTFPARGRPNTAFVDSPPSRRLVPAITSALGFSTDFESVQGDIEDFLNPETPTRSPTTRGTTPNISSPEGQSKHTALHGRFNSTPNTSTETFNSLKHKSNANPGIAKDIFDRRTFKGLSKRRHASVTPIRTTDAFRHTVRKIIVEGNQAEDLREFSHTFKLATPMPADIATITSRSTSRMDVSEVNGGRENSVLESVERVRTPKPKEKATVKFGRGQKDRADGCRKVTQKKLVEGLKEFGRTFQLSSPLPVDVAEILKIDLEEQARERPFREKAEDSDEFSQILELPVPEYAAVSNAGPAKMKDLAEDLRWE